MLRKYCAGNQPFIQWFDKEDGWRRQSPRGTMELFPRYKVFKRAEQRAKQYVFEVTTDAESMVLAAESETVLDLWVIQLQMQTLMNPRIAGLFVLTEICHSLSERQNIYVFLMGKMPLPPLTPPNSKVDPFIGSKV